MARPIDRGEVLYQLERLALEAQLTDECEEETIRRCIAAVKLVPTLTPPNEPLTLDKKRMIAKSCLHYSKSGSCTLRGYAPLDCPRCKEWQSNESNEPLTLEELREMDGEPVYIIAKDMGIAEWNVITGKEPIAIAYDCPMPGFKSVVEGIAFANGRAFRAGAYGITWLAYRRPPEGEV